MARRGSVSSRLALSCAVLTLSVNSQAEERAQLASYQRAQEAVACPDEASFREAVRARLGREPFDSEASRTVAVSVRRRAGWFALDLSIDGAARSVRARRCEDAVRAASLTVAIALDPELALGVARRAPEGRAAALEPPPAMPPGFRESPENVLAITDPERAPSVVLWDARWRAPSPVALSETELSFAMGARVGLAPGLGESLARPSFSLSVGLRRGLWLFALESSADLPGRASDPARRAFIDGTIWTASASVCRFADGMIAPFFCARATGGALAAWSSGYVVDGAALLPLALAGARAGVDFGLSRRWALRLALDGDLAIARPALVVDGADAPGEALVFRSPIAAAGLWIGARMWL